MREERLAQVEHDVLADPAREVGLGVRRRQVRGGEDDERSDHEVEDAQVASVDAGVDADLDEIGDGEAREDDDDHGDDAECGATAVR